MQKLNPTPTREDSCLSKYFQCVIGTWRIAYGWLRLINKITIAASIVLTSLATMAQLDPESQGKIGLAAIICESIAFLSEEIYDYSNEAIAERKKLLDEMEKEEAGIEM